MISVKNVNGELASGECCDGPRDPQDLRCSRHQCRTYLRVCLKEYQMEVNHRSACTFGEASTPVLGGNTFALKGARSNPGKADQAGRISIPFQFAWPVSGAAPVRVLALTRLISLRFGTESSVKLLPPPPTPA